MPLTEAKRRANRSWDKKNYDLLTLRVSKGKKDDIKELATKQGLSLNAFVVRAIDEAMRKDNGDTVTANE